MYLTAVECNRQQATFSPPPAYTNRHLHEEQANGPAERREIFGQHPGRVDERRANPNLKDVDGFGNINVPTPLAPGTFPHDIAVFHAFRNFHALSSCPLQLRVSGAPPLLM